MPQSPKINNFIKSMLHASVPGADYAGPSRESSMLPSALLQSALDNYLQNVIPAYQHQYTTSDQVLEGLVSHISEQIKLLQEKTLGEIDKQIKRLGTITQETQSQLTRLIERRKRVVEWDKSVTNKEMRSEFDGNTEIGRYHTALRVLLDKETIFWPSLLHKGSEEYIWTPNQNKKIYYRDLLAYFWLAARASNEQETFISNLHEIGREHNEGVYTLSQVNNPSCSPGTIGRLLRHSCITNEIITLPFLNKKETPAYEEIPHRLEQFIFELLKKQDPKIQASVFAYINDKLLFLESLSEEDKINFIILLKY